MYDLAILGGGLAGLSLALQVKDRQPTASILVLEKRAHPVPEAAHKVGESTVEVAAHYFSEVLGLRGHIDEQQLPKLGLRFFFPRGANDRVENRLELGGRRYAPSPSFQLDRGRFENHLADLCLQRGIDFTPGAWIDGFEMAGKKQPHSVRYSIDKQPREATAKWLVDASGRRAFLKRKLDLGQESPHHANAAWLRLDRHIKVDDFCSDPAWTGPHEGKLGRWYSTNHMMGKGYWVWMIPLASGSTSLGIVAASEYHNISDFNSLDKAIDWLAKHEPQVADAVIAGRDHVQDFRAIKNYATECKQVFSGDRWGITGEAGFFHDPFYSPGSDFIAISNTFLTDLIDRDLGGRGYKIRARVYDAIYKKFYYGTSHIYTGQYGIFGNPQVMPVKILWDYLVYWSLTAFIFMQDRTCEQTSYMRNMRRLSALGEANREMQVFFRKWHEATDGTEAEGYVDISDVPIVREMNTRLLDDLAGGKFFKRFAANLAQMQTLACEIVAHSGISHDLPFRPSARAEVRPNAFGPVFDNIRPVDRLPASPTLTAASTTTADSHAATAT